MWWWPGVFQVVWLSNTCAFETKCWEGELVGGQNLLGANQTVSKYLITGLAPVSSTDWIKLQTEKHI